MSDVLLQLCEKASLAKYELQTLDTETKNKVLKLVADALLRNAEEILAANEEDMIRAREKNMPVALQDRLKLTLQRLEGMAEGLIQISQLPDPIGEIIENFERPNGLRIEKCRVPMGVIGIIYEARPNVTADAFGLCFKTGNVVILKGGSDALSTNIAVVKVIRQVLEEQSLNPAFVSLIADASRDTTAAFMKMNRYVNLLIPRGGAGLIKSVVENSSIPVIETGTGNCHVYVDEFANLEMAATVILNAKTQRIGVCNSMESLVVHEKVKDAFLPILAETLKEKNVELRGDEGAKAVLPDIVSATEDDFGREYLDYILSIKTVAGIEEAIAHINQYNTGHSESIITENKEHADLFLKKVDAACVYVNASTRFTDGFEFGFGAEIGISTQMLHARGPMGLKELTSYKYLIHGQGQIRQ